MRRFRFLIIALIGIISVQCGVLGATIGYRWAEQQWLAQLVIGLSTEILGALVIFVLIERFISGSEREEGLKTQFIGMMGCNDNEIALRGAAELHARGWLSDGTLEGKDFRGANLRGLVLKAYETPNGEKKLPNLRDVNLKEANLSLARALDKVDLSRARLDNAFLRTAQFSEVILRNASLRGAYLDRVAVEGWKKDFISGCNLKNADLHNADLRGACLDHADLRGTDLTGADLAFASHWGTYRDENTVLPDGTKGYAAPDLTRFTNPKHPCFWRSDDSESPAYRDNELPPPPPSQKEESHGY